MAFGLLSSCSALDAFQDEIRRSGHIPFANPLARAEPGTLLGGTPSRLQLVAPPETCFPREIDGQPTDLRFVDDTTLPSRTEMVSVGFDANVKLLKAISGGNGTFEAGAKFKYVHRMELKFEDVHVEYMDSIRLTQFYRDRMPELCKDYLDQVAFIIQAIRAGKMSFKFFDSTNAELKLSQESLQDVIDIGADLQFEIQNSVELVITTPKYLGYQLGKLQRKDAGFAFYRASRTKSGRFVFDSIGVFKPEPQVRALGAEKLPDPGWNEFLPLDPALGIRVF